MRRAARTGGPRSACTRLHADVRCQPAEEQASRPQHTPHLANHARELPIVFCEVQHGAAEHDIGERIGECHLLDWLDIGSWSPADRERAASRARGPTLSTRGRRPRRRCRSRSSRSRRGCGRRRSRRRGRACRPNAPAEELIEEVDVYLTELGHQISHVVSILRGARAWLARDAFEMRAPGLGSPPCSLRRQALHRVAME